MRRISTSRYACATMALAMAALVLSLPGCGAIDVESFLGENACVILNCDGILFIGEAEGDNDDMDGMGDGEDEEDGHDEGDSGEEGDGDV